MSKPIVDKVVAYITSGNRLMVFRHVHYPEAGVQVPAGTKGVNETPLKAAFREAREESDLQQLTLVSFLGERDVDVTPYGKEQVHHRWFFHFEAPSNLPERWRHDETDPSDGSADVYEFEFSWAGLEAQDLTLAGEQDAMLPELHRSMNHVRYIRRCFELARSALQKGNAPFGALLVHQGKVLFEAENTTNTDHDVTRHADMNVISLAARSLPAETLAQCTMYSSTEPCVMCTGAVEMAGIRHVVFGLSTRALVGVRENASFFDSRAMLRAIGSPAQVEGPILEAEGLQIFQEQPQS